MWESFLSDEPLEPFSISPFREMGAYEALWFDTLKPSFRSIAQRFAEKPGSLPSSFVAHEVAHKYAEFVVQRFKEAGIENFGVRIRGAGEYPEKLLDATNPLQLFYYQGWWDLAASPSVSVVGTRQPSHEGLVRTRKLVEELVNDGYTIVSGLAAGIDTKAHETAMAEGGRTIAVIGTPLTHTYPKQNADLQRRIADEFLVVSQVPLKRYEAQDYRVNRFFFPERNVTMAALSQATVIVEAGETSGALTQARAAIQQGRDLFILNSCFEMPQLTWPATYEAKGAIRVREYDDIRTVLANKALES